MSLASSSDLARIDCHRAIWRDRPELRAVYEEWFRELLHAVRGLSPVVEAGAGPGFFKEFCPEIVATDVVVRPWIDVTCDAVSLPFRSESVGALVMIDVLHHLARPLAFMTEASRVLKRGGRLAMIEPWITPFSFVVYRFLHDEECRLRPNLHGAFDDSRKNAFDGNAAIPHWMVKQSKGRIGALVLRHADPMLALAYLLSLGFKRRRPVPQKLLQMGSTVERLLGPVARLNATRIQCVWEKA